MTRLRFKLAGIVPHSHGMKAYESKCPDCARIIPIDDTTLKTRIPGEDDDKEYYND